MILLLAIFLAGCSLPHSIPELWSPRLTETPASDTAYTECGWNWASQALPNLSAEVQAAMESAGLTGVTAVAEAYGENCLTGSGEVDHFAAMETDFRIRLEVPDLADTAALGRQLERILVVLDAFPPESTPGPQPGYIGVRFIEGAQEISLWFTVTHGVSARAQGLHGYELFLELQK